MFAFCTVSSSASASSSASVSSSVSDKKTRLQLAVSIGKKALCHGFALRILAMAKKVVVFLARVVAKVCLALFWCVTKIAFFAVKSIMGCLMDIVSIVYDETKKSIRG